MRESTRYEQYLEGGPPSPPPMYFPGSSSFRSFIPGGMSQVPGKNPKPTPASLNSPGRRPRNSLLTNLARVPAGKKYDEGNRYQSLPKQTVSPARTGPRTSKAR